MRIWRQRSRRKSWMTFSKHTCLPLPNPSIDLSVKWSTGDWRTPEPDTRRWPRLWKRYRVCFCSIWSLVYSPELYQSNALLGKSYAIDPELKSFLLLTQPTENVHFSKILKGMLIYLNFHNYSWKGMHATKIAVKQLYNFTRIAEVALDGVSGDKITRISGKFRPFLHTLVRTFSFLFHSF